MIDTHLTNEALPNAGDGVHLDPQLLVFAVKDDNSFAAGRGGPAALGQIIRCEVRLNRSFSLRLENKLKSI